MNLTIASLKKFGFEKVVVGSWDGHGRTIDVYDDEAVAFVDKIMDMIRTEAKRWDNINKEYERGEEE